MSMRSRTPAQSSSIWNGGWVARPDLIEASGKSMPDAQQRLAVNRPAGATPQAGTGSPRFASSPAGCAGAPSPIFRWAGRPSAAGTVRAMAPPRISGVERPMEPTRPNVPPPHGESGEVPGRRCGEPPVAIDTAAFGSLSEAEHARLLSAAGEGDQAARLRLVSEHLEWVSAEAAERADDTLTQADLYQEGVLGLMEAVADFSGGTAEQLETFSRRCIAASIEQARGAEVAARKAAQEVVEDAEQYERVEIFLRRELGRTVTDQELAAKLEWTEQRTGEMGDLIRAARRRHDAEMVPLLDLDELEPNAHSRHRATDSEKN